MGWMRDETGLERNAANFVPLTPLSHLKRARRLYPDQEAVVYKFIRRTYSEYYERCTRLASGLAKLGVAPGDVVATILPNLPPHAEAHFGVPACGAVLNAINTRLEADTIAYILDHGEAKALLVDPQFLPVLADAVEQMEGPAPIVIEVADDEAGVHAHGHYTEYEE
ncbi:MAG TPA: AMP-binding protein, partial [Roseovarius sp.]|nr:AMP-binding protein [Roseovarius sp.]